MRKRASDGGEGMVDDSSVPDDPNGNGTVDYTTGEFDASVDKEVDKNSDSNADDDDVATEGDVVAAIDNIGTDVAEVDDHVVDEYNLEVPDYGTDTPMKTSSYKYASLSLSQLQSVFRKKASAVLADIRERNTQKKTAAAESPVQDQQASADPNLQLYDNMRKLAAIQAEAEHDAALTAANIAHVVKKAAAGEEITEEDAPVEVDDAPATMTDTIDASPEVSLDDVPPEVLEELISAPDEQLQLIEEVQDAVDAGQLSPEEGIEILQGGSDETPASDEEVKEAAYRQWRMRKIAEEIPVTEEDIAAANKLPAADIEAIDALPPEAIDSIIALEEAVEAGEISPEVAVAAIEGDPAVEAAIEEAAQSDAPATDVIAAGPAADTPVSDDEAAAEFSSVLADEGVTPDDLEAVAAADETSEKSASALRTISKSVSRYRTKNAAYHVTKSARQAAIRQRCRKVLTELMTGN